MNFTLVSVAVAAAIGFGAGFGSAWTLQGRNIDSIKLEAANERITIQRAARATIERTSNAVIAAQSAAATRAPVLRRNAVAASSAGNGLRIASTATVRAAADYTDACRAIISAYDGILIESSSFSEEVAAVADQCISDVKTLTEAWQK